MTPFLMAPKRSLKAAALDTTTIFPGRKKKSFSKQIFYSDFVLLFQG